jgi:hypothetical protein
MLGSMSVAATWYGVNIGNEKKKGTQVKVWGMCNSLVSLACKYNYLFLKYYEQVSYV